MVSIRQLRQHPHFAPLFAHVHALFWPILWWSLNRLLIWLRASDYDGVLFGTTRWGFVYIAYLGDKRADPAAYKPIERTFRPLTDESWGSALPSTLREAGAREDQKSPCDFPAVAAKRTEGAGRPTLTPNTS